MSAPTIGPDDNEFGVRETAREASFPNGAIAMAKVVQRSS